MDKAKTGQAFIGLFIAGSLLFNFPILSIFNKDTVVLGLTSIMEWYLFGVWFLFIFMLFLTSTFLSGKNESSFDDDNILESPETNQESHIIESKKEE